MLEKIYNAVENDIKKEINVVGFIFDGDNSDRFIDKKIKEEIEKNCKGEDEKELYFEEVLRRIIEYMKKDYKKVWKNNKEGIYTGYFYKNDYNFKTVEELENFFNIGE